MVTMILTYKNKKIVPLALLITLLYGFSGYFIFRDYYITISKTYVSAPDNAGKVQNPTPPGTVDIVHLPNGSTLVTVYGVSTLNLQVASEVSMSFPTLETWPGILGNTIDFIRDAFETIAVDAAVTLMAFSALTSKRIPKPSLPTAHVASD
jgi:hypothetical protein